LKRVDLRGEEAEQDGKEEQSKAATPEAVGVVGLRVITGMIPCLGADQDHNLLVIYLSETEGIDLLAATSSCSKARHHSPKKSYRVREDQSQPTDPSNHWTSWTGMEQQEPE